MHKSLFDSTSHNRKPTNDGSYYCVGKKSECNVFEQDGAKLLGWNKNLNLDVDISALRIMPTEKQIESVNYNMPGDISKLSNLSFLQLPISMLTCINVGDIPNSLKTLLVINTEKNKCKNLIKWDSISCLPGLDNLIFQSEFGSSNCMEMFSDFNINSFNLKYLSFDFMKNGNLLNNISSESDLKEVAVSYVGNFDLFDHLPLGLELLTIVSAEKDFQFANVRNLNKMKAIRLNGIKSEIDCALFIDMKELIEINIINSKKIINSEQLLENKNLRRINIVNCGNPLKSIKNKFNHNDYELLNIQFS